MSSSRPVNPSFRVVNNIIMIILNNSVIHPDAWELSLPRDLGVYWRHSLFTIDINQLAVRKKSTN